MSVDGSALLACAERQSVVVEILPSIGDFVVAELPLLRVARASALEGTDRERLLACFTIDRQRTVHQDAPFGLQQIVDIGMKALSPSVNDPTTAMACVDHLSALLGAMASRRIPSPSPNFEDAPNVTSRPC